MSICTDHGTPNPCWQCQRDAETEAQIDALVHEAADLRAQNGRLRAVLALPGGPTQAEVVAAFTGLPVADVEGFLASYATCPEQPRSLPSGFRRLAAETNSGRCQERRDTNLWSVEDTCRPAGEDAPGRTEQED